MSNFSFGFKATTAPATNFSFGNPTITAAAATTGGGGLRFGVATTTATQITPFGGGFNTPAAPSSIGGFGGFSSAFNTQTTTAPSFGSFSSTPLASQTTTAQTGLGGFGTGFAAASTASSFGSGFFSASSAATPAKKQVTFTGIGSTPATTTTPFQATLSVGLGGFDLKKGQTSGLASNEVTRIGEAKSAKDQVILPELLTTVEQFNTFIRGERKVRDEIGRLSSKRLFDVQKECAQLKQQLHEVAALLQKNSSHVEKCKRDAMQDLKDSEIAQRSKDTPLGLQSENLLPIEYFQRLVDSFERQMETYCQQVLEAEQFFSSIRRPPTPSELSSVFEKLNEGFVALAARLQVVNEGLQRQKDSYIRYKQTYHHDHIDIFKRPVNQSLSHLPTTTIGPTPFSHVGNMSSVAMNPAVNQLGGIVR